MGLFDFLKKLFNPATKQQLITDEIISSHTTVTEEILNTVNDSGSHTSKNPEIDTSDWEYYNTADGRFGYKDSSGTIKIQAQFYGVKGCGFSEGLTAVQFEKSKLTVEGLVYGKWGFIDAMANTIIPAQYDSAENFHNGIAMVSQNGKWGFIDKNGDWVIKPKYDSGRVPDDSPWYIVEESGKFGFLKNSSHIIPLKYDDVGFFKYGYAPVKNNGKWGYICEIDELVTEMIYDTATEFGDGKAEATINATQIDIEIDNDGKLKVNNKETSVSDTQVVQEEPHQQNTSSNSTANKAEDEASSAIDEPSNNNYSGIEEIYWELEYSDFEAWEVLSLYEKYSDYITCSYVEDNTGWSEDALYINLMDKNFEGKQIQFLGLCHWNSEFVNNYILKGAAPFHNRERMGMKILPDGRAYQSKMHAEIEEIRYEPQQTITPFQLRQILEQRVELPS